MSIIKALDVSKHQHTFDPKTAKAAGIDAVITRLAYAANPDRLALSWCPGIKAAGLRLGAFGFATWHYKDRCGSDVATARQLMAQQVDTWVRLAKQHGVDWWLAIDQEMEGGHQMGLDPSTNTQLLNEACARIRAAGLHPCVYTGASWASRYIGLDLLAAPFWVAYYYDDPDDPDFDKCRDLYQLTGRWGALLQDLHRQGKLMGWQYGRIGYGDRYGVASANVDRDWIYFQPGKDENMDMDFVKIEGKMLEVTKTKPACQAFAAPTVQSDSWYNLPLGQYPITAQGDTTQLAGMTGTWYKIDCPAAKDCVHVLALPDRCQVVDAPAPEPQQPAVPDTPAEPVKPAPVPVILQPRLDLSGLAADLRRLADAIDGKVGA